MQRDKNFTTYLTLWITFFILASSCSLSYPSPTSVPIEEPIHTSIAFESMGYCGDGECAGPEDAQKCPMDCGDYGGMHPSVPFSGRCGDGTCEGPENSIICPEDCQDFASDSFDRSSVVIEVDQERFYSGTEDECWSIEAMRASTATEFAEIIENDIGSVDAPLYFGIVVHIEPHESYTDVEHYRKDANRLRRMAQIIASHQGKMTIQTQPPFLETAEQLGDPFHQDMIELGNEIALHFHENVYVGSDRDDLPVDVYIDAMAELKAEIEAIAGMTISNWSGGNTYIHMWEAASQAGFTSNTNYKNRFTQTSAPGFAVVNPWRPAGAENQEARLAHDPNGPVIYVPSGVYPVHCDKLEAVPRPYEHEAFDYVTRALRASLEVASSDKVNTFYITFHPGDFLALDDDEEEYVVWDAWFAEVIDPFVDAGLLKWATIGEMAEAFETWETKQEN